MGEGPVPTKRRIAPWSGALLLLALTLALAGPGTADEPTPRTRWESLRPEAIEALHALADWCTSAKLFRARAEVYEAVLRFDADDAKARRWLRYKRDRDGTWKRKPGYKKPADRGRGRDRYEAQVEEWRGWFAKEAARLMQTARAAGDDRLADEVLQTAVRVAPSDASLRHANREVQVEREGKSVWILEESKRALERRQAHREAGRKAVEAVAPPKPGTLSVGEEANGLPWSGVLQGPNVRILGMPDKAEMGTSFRFCEASWPVFRAVFGIEPPTWSDKGRYTRGVTVYVFSSLEAGNTFLARQPGVTERELKFVSPLVGTWIPGRSAFLVKTHDPTSRLECAPRMLLSAMTYRKLGINDKRGWAAEGLAHYLTYLVAGTRMLSSVTDEDARYGKPQGDIPEDDFIAPTEDDWLTSGLALLTGDEKPDLFLMAGKDVNHITTPEVLYGYCLVAYLVEGWPDASVEFFRAVGGDAQVDLDGIALGHLGFGARTLEQRLVRWLEETTARRR